MFRSYWLVGQVVGCSDSHLFFSFLLSLELLQGGGCVVIRIIGAFWRSVFLLLLSYASFLMLVALSVLWLCFFLGSRVLSYMLLWCCFSVPLSCMISLHWVCFGCVDGWVRFDLLCIFVLFFFWFCFVFVCILVTAFMWVRHCVGLFFVLGLLTSFMFFFLVFLCLLSLTLPLLVNFLPGFRLFTSSFFHQLVVVSSFDVWLLFLLCFFLSFATLLFCPFSLCCFTFFFLVVQSF